MTTTITPDTLCRFARHLKDEERSSGTWEKYLRDVRRFARWLGDRPLTREQVSDWKLHLLENGYAPATVNSMLAALNTTDHNAYMGGYKDGTFGPSRSITRAEVASAFHRLLLDKDADMDKTFSDVAEDSWYYDAVRTAVSYSWIGGYEDGTFRPEQKISRAEAIAIMNRMLARIADHSAIDDGAGTRFADVAENHWAFYDITEAATAHDYSRPSNSDEEHWK